MLALVVAGVFACMATLKPGWTVVAVSAVAIYSVALYGDRTRTLLTAGCVLAVTVAVMTLFSDRGLLSYDAVTRLGVLLIALVLGDAVRSRRTIERTAAQREVERERRARDDSERRLADERLRIAREVHDVVAHAMVAINVQAGVAAHVLHKRPGQAETALTEIKRVSGAALDDLRATLGLLRDENASAPVHPTRVLSGVPDLAAPLRAAGVRVDVEVDGPEGSVTSPVGAAAYRIVQEALTNVLRHGDASSAAVRVAIGAQSVEIDVRNDGVAPVDRAAGQRRGHRERAARDGRARRGARRARRGRPAPRRRLAGARRPAARTTALTLARRAAARRRHAVGLSISVLIADDQALVRAGFAALLEAEDDLEVCGEASDGEEALRLARSLAPDIVLMDVRMPRMDGLEATAAITSDERLPDTRVVVLTTFELDEYVFGALRAGASGFLLKDLEAPDLLAAIRVVAEGDALLAPRVTRRLIEAFARSPERALASPPSLDELTAREREVLALVGAGLSNGEIADRLVVSPLTAKTHVSRLLMKLGARDRAQLVVVAYESGLVVPGGLSVAHRLSDIRHTGEGTPAARVLCSR